MLRRIRVLTFLCALPVVLGFMGCDCDSGAATDSPTMMLDDDVPLVMCGTVMCAAGESCCDEAMSLCADETPSCSAPYDCDNLVFNPAPACNSTAPLQTGRLAEHLDMAVSSTGAVLISAYSSGFPPFTNYGDLIVGVYNGGGPEDITWSHIDGLPTEGGSTLSFDEQIVGDPNGWRGGIRDTMGSPDVGEWNSIEVNGSTVGISYYDADNGDVKYASSTDDGATWTTHTVYEPGDSGRYTSLAFLANGNPAIAFNSLVPATDGMAQPTSLLRVAIASSNAPTSSEDWVIQDVPGSGGVTPCGSTTCPEGFSCRDDTGFCSQPSADPETDCSHESDEGVVAGCAGADFCMNGCEDANGDGTCDGALAFECTATAIVTDDPANDPTIDNPNGPVFVQTIPEIAATFAALRAFPGAGSVAEGLVVTWYDRRATNGGTLMGSTYDSAGDTWDATPFVIDGYGANPNAGDRGQRQDMEVDANGNLHIAYVDATWDNRGRVLYAVIDGTSLGGAPAFVIQEDQVDEGLRVGQEGPSIVGADIDLVIDGAGQPRITYQDQTTGQALLAIRDAATNTWGDGVVVDDGGGPVHGPIVVIEPGPGAGNWTTQGVAGETSFVASWAFTTQGTNLTTVREYAPATP